jgi:mannose-6-phosphate isomerase-like protein (cupin superfamily)
MSVIRIDSLPFSSIAHELVGSDHGAGVCLIFVDAPPGKVVGLHRHPYEEIIVVRSGRAAFTVGDKQLEARAGEVVIVPAGVAHAFATAGDEPLRQLDIHVSPSFSTEWL